jgi:LysM repeat protein/ABC-type branched-subunit amino acid transport system substrate-binding protein
MFSQNFSKHTVAKGETIATIAQKYKVTPYDIYKLNPDSQNGLKVNSVILIPNKDSVVSNSNSEPKVFSSAFSSDKPKTHLVLAKETMYSISKKYNVSISDLEKWNPILKTEGLQPGQVLKVSEAKITTVDKVTPLDKEKVLVTTKNIKTINHVVLPKETKYGIAKQHGISVEELEKQNPEIKDSLPIGFNLKIISTNKTTSVVTTDIIESLPKQGEIASPVTNNSNTINYTVKLGETLYSLSKMFNLTQERLVQLNPELQNGVQEGMILNLPPYAAFAKSDKTFVDLSQTLNTSTQKKLAFLLPFNMSRIEKDSVYSTKERLQKDKFLNMTLDFYAGALMAIDSAKTLGLNFDVQFYDSNETKTSTDAISVIKNKRLDNCDAIIGPLYQDNLEKVALYLQDKKVPVISPLSKDYAKSVSNLYQSMPPYEATKNAMFNYMRSKNGNILVIVNPKKNSIKEYLQQNQMGFKMVNENDAGRFVGDSIKKYFVKDKINFVVMATEKTSTIFMVTNAMLSAMKDYQMQLVILEDNETLDFEEIALSRLTKLKMTYPTITNQIETGNKTNFEKQYKNKYRTFPTPYATRGFDITLDTMLRLSQSVSFEETIQTMASEQLESKFDYTTKIDGGYLNKGTFILFYDTDLTIQKAP